MKFLDAARLFRGCWELYRKYYGQKMSKELWDQFVEETELLYQKFKKAPMAKELIMAVVNEIERIDKRERRDK